MGAKYEIYGVVNQVVAKGKTVIMISSEMPELLGTCDRIYVMNEEGSSGNSQSKRRLKSESCTPS